MKKAESKPLIRINYRPVKYWGLRLICSEGRSHGGNHFGNVSKSGAGLQGVIALKETAIVNIAVQGGNFNGLMGYAIGPSLTGGGGDYVGHVPFGSGVSAFRYLEQYFRLCACPGALVSLNAHGIDFIPLCDESAGAGQSTSKRPRRGSVTRFGLGRSHVSPPSSGPALLPPPVLTGPKAQAAARMLFEKWIASQKLQTPDAMIAMIATQNDGITARLEKTRTRPLRVVRSSALVVKTRIIAKSIKDSIQNDSKACQGAIYLVFRKTDKGEIDPLYVGIAEAYGQKGVSLSALVKNGSMRFSDYYKSGGHIGNINDALFGKKSSEEHWVGALFSTQSTLSGKTPKAVLKQPVFVHFEIWGINCKSMIPKQRLPNLREEETTRIRILRDAGYRGQLLNRT
jgi:hypothetical protein